MSHRVRRRQPLERVANACEPCKRRKVKCSGKSPCESCIGRRIQCIFKQAEKKVIVTESYLRKLQESYEKTGLKHETPQASTSVQVAKSPSPMEESLHSSTLTNAIGEEPITNPLVSATSFYLRDTSGHYRFCGPSSTWSFSQRVFLLFKAELPDFPSPDLPFHVDGSTWELKWNRTTLDDKSVFDGLPSYSDFLHLLNVVQFHTYQMLFLVDEEKFMPLLQAFYEKGAEHAKKAPVWFVQYLLIIALAKALLGASRGPNSPPGYDFFERAMALMPEFVGLHRYANLAMQVLCLVGLYLVSVDMKDAAFAYIGQSMRMCIVEGIHREPPVDLFGAKFANECRNIWWTAYILDRQLSAMVGAPTSIQDTEITSSLPISYETSDRAKFMTVHVRLSRIIGDVLASVYTADVSGRRSFISTVQSVLRDMADILRDIEDICAHNAHPSLCTVSTRTSHLCLTYHQCIILATRPLFLYFLTTRLKRPHLQGHNTSDLIPAQLRPLLETSLRSAKISLRTLFTLYEQSSLESFLPFALDSIFSPAFIVIVAAFIDPILVPDMISYTTIVSRMLDDHSSKGNMAAQLRKRELDLLQEMIYQIVHTEGTAGDDVEDSTLMQNTTEQGLASFPNDDGRGMGQDEVGMSYTQILNLAQQLDTVNDSSWGTDFEFEYSNLWI